MSFELLAIVPHFFVRVTFWIGNWPSKTESESLKGLSWGLCFSFFSRILAFYHHHLARSSSLNWCWSLGKTLSTHFGKYRCRRKISTIHLGGIRSWWIESSVIYLMQGIVYYVKCRQGSRSFGVANLWHQIWPGRCQIILFLWTSCGYSLQIITQRKVAYFSL